MKNLLSRSTSNAAWLIALAWLLTACTQGSELEGSDQSSTTENAGQVLSSTGERYADYDIITLLPRDAIPAIDDPKFATADEANSFYDDDELILGVEFNGDARAYSVPLLSSHEIVNDMVGGVKIAVTW